MSIVSKIVFENKKAEPFASVADVQEFITQYHCNDFTRIVKVRPEVIDPNYLYEADCFLAISFEVEKNSHVCELNFIDQDGEAYLGIFENFNEMIEYIDLTFEGVNDLC